MFPLRDRPIPFEGDPLLLKCRIAHRTPTVLYKTRQKLVSRPIAACRRIPPRFALLPDSLDCKAVFDEAWNVFAGLKESALPGAICLLLFSMLFHVRRPARHALQRKLV